MKIYYRAGADRTAEILRCIGTDPEVVLPERIGRYIFYGCRNLRKLGFSDRMKDIGSGAFRRTLKHHQPAQRKAVRTVYRVLPDGLLCV